MSAETEFVLEIVWLLQNVEDVFCDAMTPLSDVGGKLDRTARNLALDNRVTQSAWNARMHVEYGS